MNRRDLVKLGVAQAAMVAVPGGVVVQTAAQATSKNAESVTVSNAQFQLTVTPSENLQCRLLHVPTGRVLAEDAYSYSFGTPVSPECRKRETLCCFKAASLKQA